jgi:hypothetical protein
VAEIDGVQVNRSERSVVGDIDLQAGRLANAETGVSVSDVMRIVLVGDQQQLRVGLVIGDKPHGRLQQMYGAGRAGRSSSCVVIGIVSGDEDLAGRRGVSGVNAKDE